MVLQRSSGVVSYVLPSRSFHLKERNRDRRTERICFLGYGSSDGMPRYVWGDRRGRYYIETMETSFLFGGHVISRGGNFMARRKCEIGNSETLPWVIR